MSDVKNIVTDRKESLDKMNNKTTVVFSTNEEYALYCYTSIYSLISVANPNRKYDIRIMMTTLSKENCEMLEQLSTENVSVLCLNISSYVKEFDLRAIGHLSVEALYRLLIPLIFKECQKVIYLDTDLIIRRDVAELLEYPLNGNAIGAVREICTTFLRQHSYEIGMKSCADMFNSGVLVIDTKQYEKMKIRQKAMALLVEDYQSNNRRYTYLDQDVLNLVLQGTVTFLDDRWNFLWHYTWRTEMIEERELNRYFEVEHDPWIVHYAGDKKPWTYPTLVNADYFWDTVKKARIFEKVAEKSFLQKQLPPVETAYFERYRFPYEVIPAGSNIAIYAAGEVGKALFNQIKFTNYVKPIMWVDKDYKRIQLELPFVDNPGKLLERIDEYDYVLIAIEKEEIVEVVKNNLKSIGIPENKIKWGKV